MAPLSEVDRSHRDRSRFSPLPEFLLRWSSIAGPNSRSLKCLATGGMRTLQPALASWQEYKPTDCKEEQTPVSKTSVALVSPESRSPYPSSVTANSAHQVCSFWAASSGPPLPERT